MLQSHQTTGLQYVHLQLIVEVAFLCSLLYWVVAFTRKEAQRREFTPQMKSMLLAVAGAAHSTRTALDDARADNSRKQNYR